MPLTSPPLNLIKVLYLIPDWSNCPVQTHLNSQRHLRFFYIPHKVLGATGPWLVLRLTSNQQQHSSLLARHQCFGLPSHRSNTHLSQWPPNLPPATLFPQPSTLLQPPIPILTYPVNHSFNGSPQAPTHQPHFNEKAATRAPMSRDGGRSDFFEA